MASETKTEKAIVARLQGSVPVTVPSRSWLRCSSAAVGSMASMTTATWPRTMPKVRYAIGHRAVRTMPAQNSSRTAAAKATTATTW